MKILKIFLSNLFILWFGGIGLVVSIQFLFGQDTVETKKEIWGYLLIVSVLLTIIKIVFNKKNAQKTYDKNRTTNKFS